MADIDIGGVYSEASIAEAVTTTVSTASVDPLVFDTIVLEEGVTVDLVGAAKAVVTDKKYVEETIYAAGFFTPALVPMPTRSTEGYLNISVSGTFTGTVTLQRSFNGGSTWFDVDTYTSSTETALVDKEPGVFYRIGVDTGDWTTGSVYVRLGINK